MLREIKQNRQTKDVPFKENCDIAAVVERSPEAIDALVPQLSPHPSKPSEINCRIDQRQPIEFDSSDAVQNEMACERMRRRRIGERAAREYIYKWTQAQIMILIKCDVMRWQTTALGLLNGLLLKLCQVQSYYQMEQQLHSVTRTFIHVEWSEPIAIPLIKKYICN